MSDHMTSPGEVREVIHGQGMFPEQPMARCFCCGQFSYLAATEAICLGCKMQREQQVWCEPDNCLATICNGPHVAHHCPNGDLVVSHRDDHSPCPFCGHIGGGT